MEALITNGAIATDGGSISLTGVDSSGAPLTVFLDWSIKSQREGTRQLHVNGEPVAWGSPDEVRWLQELTTARVEQEGLAALVQQLLSNVSSDAYNSQKRIAPPQAIDDEILELLLDGKDLEAVKVYRRAHPEVGLADARAAIEKMKTQ